MTTLDPSKPVLFTPTTPHKDALLAGVVHLHAHCILRDGTLATYLPPLSQPKMLSYWQSRLDQVAKGQRHIIISLQPTSSRTTSVPDPIFTVEGDVPVPAPTISIGGATYEVAGLVSLWKPEAETGPFRGEVEKLFSSPNHRRKGVARIVMKELETLARQDGRWNLLLGTIVGSDAEYVYPKLGYSWMGEVKDYGIDPRDRKLVDAVWFKKDLRHPTEL